MIINPLDAHDRLHHFVKENSNTIAQGAEECLKKNPFSLALQSKSPYIYLFAHPRTQEDGATKKLYWQPRLTKPAAQPNSYLFRAISGTDLLEIIWLLPPQELWGQYEKGNVTESQDIKISIDNFRRHRRELEAPHPDDMDDIRIAKVYREVVEYLNERDGKRTLLRLPI